VTEQKKGKRYIHKGCGGELEFLSRREGYKCLKCDANIPLFPKEWLEAEEEEMLTRRRKK